MLASDALHHFNIHFGSFLSCFVATMVEMGIEIIKCTLRLFITQFDPYCYTAAATIPTKRCFIGAGGTQPETPRVAKFVFVFQPHDH